VVFKTSDTHQGVIGLIVAAVLLGIAGLLATQLSGQSFSLMVFLVATGLVLDLLLLVVVLYWSIATLNLHYQLDRNGVTITWGVSRLRVPMQRIQAIVPVDKADDQTGLADLASRQTWLGGWVKRTRLADGKIAHRRSTAPAAQSAVIMTSDYAYIVSPRRPDTFVQAWRTHRPLGPTQYWREEEERTWLMGLPIWNDAIAWGLIAVAVGATIALFGYLALAYDRLPAVLAFHFDALGQPDRIGERAAILNLPLTALLLLTLDLAIGFAVYRKERVAAYLVWGGALVVQILAWGALHTIVG
jgi:hypothetical protein